MGSKRVRPLRYYVEFTAEAGRVRDLRGVIEVNVRHHSRARQAARLRLHRMGCERILVFRPSWLGPAVVASLRPKKRLSFGVARSPSLAAKEKTGMAKRGPV